MASHMPVTPESIKEHTCLLNFIEQNWYHMKTNKKEWKQAFVTAYKHQLANFTPSICLDCNNTVHYIGIYYYDIYSALCEHNLHYILYELILNSTTLQEKYNMCMTILLVLADYKSLRFVFKHDFGYLNDVIHEDYYMYMSPILIPMYGASGILQPERYPDAILMRTDQMYAECVTLTRAFKWTKKIHKDYPIQCKNNIVTSIMIKGKYLIYEKS